jgi:hypothetical protein
MGRGPRVVKRTRIYEPIGVIIYKCMETNKETPCVAIFISK